MRMILGLDRPTSGTALVNGQPVRVREGAACGEVGALLDAKAVHGGRTARAHLLALAQSNGLPARRVDEVLELTGMTSVAGKRIKGFSLGMSQRLGIAAAMLGDPQILMFDEPVNGLDPEGILWIRNFMQSLAARGPHRVRLQPPDERDGADRRAPDRHRPRPAARRHQHRGLHRPELGRRRPGPHAAAGTAAGRAGHRRARWSDASTGSSRSRAT